MEDIFKELSGLFNPNKEKFFLVSEDTENMPKYPFSEGDDYYTIEDGEVISSCWDDISEQWHTSDRKYFATEQEAIKHIDDCRDIAIRIVDSLVQEGYVKNSIDTDNRDEFEIQDLIFNQLTNCKLK
jgi:hypothetical protein